MSWLDSLERELGAASVPGRRRRRVVAELADHLACDAAAETRLGDPAELARQFADELGTTLARRAAVTAFFALAPLGALFVALFAFAALYTTNVETGVTVALVLGTQLAFVGGTLALLRAWRLRRLVVIPAAEATVLLRRSALGVAGGAVTVAALAAAASDYLPGVQWSLPALTWATVGAGAAGVLVGAVVLLRAARLQPVGAGDAGDLECDFGRLVPRTLRGNPWRVALAVAGVIVVGAAVHGAAFSDGLDGLVRGVGDGVLCLAGFTLLGRPLGLRR